MREFDWMRVELPARPERTSSTRELEILARAELLARLGFSKKRIVRRLEQNLAWEYERLGAPLVQKRIGGIVADALRRAGVAVSSPKKR